MAYIQPGSPESNEATPASYDPGKSWTSCPFCPSIAMRVGSTQFSFRCQASGHQFILSDGISGQPRLISTDGIAPLSIGPEQGT